VFRLYGDNTLAREVLRWRPEVNLDEGLRRTVEWVAQHLDQYDTTRYQV
jgi:nucleoside-diphosphate-sugar epimerase